MRKIIIVIFIVITQQSRAQEISRFISIQDSLLNIAYYTSDIELASEISNNTSKWYANLKEKDKSEALEFMQEIKYNLACVFSLANKKQDALENLEESVSLGFLDYELFATDTDLKNIRKLPRFETLLESNKSKVQLEKLSKEQLLSDFDLLISSLKEAHTGLYWYTSQVQFDSIANAQRQLIQDGQTSLDFYSVAAKVVESTKEGHCQIEPSTGSVNYLIARKGFLPLCTRFVNGDLYALNELDGSAGSKIIAINEHSIEEIKNALFETIPSDGYNETLKYEWVNNGQFAWFYNLLYPHEEACIITYIEPQSGKIRKEALERVNYSGLMEICASIDKPFGRLEEEYKNEFKVLSKGTALLSLPDFYNDKPDKFHAFVDSVFVEVKAQNIEHLIIDVRKNEGGYEGYEDYLFSYLTSKPYQKYRYVEGSSLHYSFYDYTHLNTPARQQEYDKALEKELFRDVDGRLLRKPGFLAPEPVREDAYQGELYILTSGLTYSGGSEFASIVKAHRAATFLGIETGGGYYGQTSGFILVLTLPNSKLKIRIPLLKFSVNNFNAEIPFGRGVIPDYHITSSVEDILNDQDPVMKKTLELIRKQN